MLKDSELTAKAELALRNRYAYPEWAFCTEVHADNGRMADAIAINMWPSRKFVIHGFEIKASRSDWLKELNTPSKADFFVGQCNSWYIVGAKRGIILKEEIPDGWGFMEMKNDRLFTIIHPATTHESTPSRGFYTSIIRRIFEKKDISSSVLWEARNKGRTEAWEEAKRDAQNEAEKTESTNKKLKILEDAGLHLQWMSDESVKKTVKLIKVAEALGDSGIANRFYNMKDSALRLLETIKRENKYFQLEDEKEEGDIS